jgi:hypothetical protein
MQIFLEILGRVIAYGGGGAAIAYLLFQYLGKSWIENKFNERLELLKHQQNIEAQRLRVEIDSLLSGVVRLQEREFEILPTAWRKLYRAQQTIKSLVSPFETYLKLDSFNEEQLEDVLAQTRFMESQKSEIRRSSNKTELYRELTFRYRLLEAKNVFCEYIDYFSENGILLSPQLKLKLNKASELLNSALASKEIGREHNDWKMQNEGWKKLESEVGPLVSEIENDIYARLQSHGNSSGLLTISSSNDAASGAA